MNTSLSSQKQIQNNKNTQNLQRRQKTEGVNIPRKSTPMGFCDTLDVRTIKPDKITEDVNS